MFLADTVQATPTASLDPNTLADVRSTMELKRNFTVTSNARSAWRKRTEQQRCSFPDRVIAKSGSIYKICQLLGRGGMGTVFLARRQHDNLLVALKVSSCAEDPRNLELIKYEAEVLLKLKHKNIVSVVEVGESEDGTPFIAMEYIEGQTLQRVLREEGRLSLERALNICTQIAEAIKCAHQAGILHRDLKPANIIISNQAGAEKVKVIDFGISQQRATHKGKENTLTSGSVFYMSPEQLRAEHCSTGSDIYQLALVLFECLTGRLPFEPSLSDAVMYRLGGSLLPLDCHALEQFPASLLILLSKALARDLSSRLSSMSEFLELVSSIRRGSQFSSRLLPFRAGR